jgi:uncharacterized membrane protein YkvA (DUF1232 family)
LPKSSESKCVPRKQQERKKGREMRMEAEFSFEMSVNFYTGLDGVTSQKKRILFMATAARFFYIKRRLEGDYKTDGICV